MMTKVIVLLAAAAGHIPLIFPSRKEAFQFVTDWKNRQSKRIENGKFQEVETSLYSTPFLDDPSLIGSAIIGQYVIGMYVAADEKSSQDRIADAQAEFLELLKNQTNQGDEWRG